MAKRGRKPKEKVEGQAESKTVNKLDNLLDKAGVGIEETSGAEKLIPPTPPPLENIATVKKSEAKKSEGNSAADIDLLNGVANTISKTKKLLFYMPFTQERVQRICNDHDGEIKATMVGKEITLTKGSAKVTFSL